MEKNEEKKKEFLYKTGLKFMNEALKEGYNSADMIDLSFSMMYLMVNFSYFDEMPDDMSEEKKYETAENATLFSIVKYGKDIEKQLIEKGLSCSEIEKEIEMIKNKAKNKKEE